MQWRYIVTVHRWFTSTPLFYGQYASGKSVYLHDDRVKIVVRRLIGFNNRHHTFPPLFLAEKGLLLVKTTIKMSR